MAKAQDFTNGSIKKQILTFALPILLGNLFQQFYTLADTAIAGHILGDSALSAIGATSSVSSLILTVAFGINAGFGIVIAQAFGEKNNRKLKRSFAQSIMFGLIFSVLVAAISPLIINSVLRAMNTPEEIFSDARAYILILLEFVIVTMFYNLEATVLRSLGDSKTSVIFIIISTVVNIFLDWLFMAKLNLGVKGAAAATVLARVVECVIVVWWTHARADKNHFIVGAYRDFKIPGTLVRQIIIKGTPLLLNETLWAGGMAVLMQCYSTRGLAVVAGFNISNTVANLFNVVFIALGSAISIIVGQQLGAGKLEEAVDTDRKMIVFSVFCCLVIGACMFAIAPFFPRIYNTTEEVRGLAKQFIRIASACMPLYGFMHATYFTLRSGGKTVITFLFDSVYVWVVDIPLAFVLTRFTGLPIVPIYLSCQLIEIIKCIIGYVMVKKKIWVNNMVMEH